MAERVSAEEEVKRTASRAKKEDASSMVGGVAVDETVRTELTNILTGLITTAQELGFELATLDDPKLLDHPVVKKARELIIQLKKLFALQKKLRT